MVAPVIFLFDAPPCEWSIEGKRFEKECHLMDWKIYKAIPLLALMLALPYGVSAANQPPPKGGVLPNFELPVPNTPHHRHYLGLNQGSVFSIPEINAEVVIIEIFSMY